MNTTEYIAKMKQNLHRLEEGEHVFIAISDHVADMSVRIFEQGLNSEGAKIGSYNTTDEMYINTSKGSPKKLKGKGKPIDGKKGKSIHENKEPYKTTYFTSYSEYRKAMGRSNKSVNLNLSGNLKLDFENGLIKVGKGLFNLSLKQSINRDIIDGQEEHFGGNKIFYPTQEEQSELLKVVQFETIKIMRGL